MERFVVLWHEMPPGSDRQSHYDFMLECGPHLRTWALDVLPACGATVEGQALSNHRLEYLDYEGHVTRERGHVTRVDRGTYTVADETGEALIVNIQGEKIRGRLTIQRRPTGDQRWRFSLEAEPMVST